MVRYCGSVDGRGDSVRLSCAGGLCCSGDRLVYSEEMRIFIVVVEAVPWKKLIGAKATRNAKNRTSDRMWGLFDTLSTREG